MTCGKHEVQPYKTMEGTKKSKEVMIMKNNHINEEIIEEYVLYQTTDKDFNEFNEEISTKYGVDLHEIEEHFAECDQCAEKLNEIYTQFNNLSEWNIYEDNQIIIQNRAVNAIEACAKTQQNEEIKQRLLNWYENLKAVSGSTVKVLVQTYSAGKRKASRFFTEGLGFLNPKNSLNFDYALIPDSMRGEVGEPMVNLKEIISEKDDLDIKVRLNDKGNEMKITIKADRINPPPMAMLMSFESNATPILATPEWNEEKKEWETIIKDIPEGEYSLLFEPAER
jgi:hypothetical protein